MGSTGSTAATTQTTVSILVTLRTQLVADLADAKISGARSWDAYSVHGTLIVSVPIDQHVAKLEASIADIDVSIAVDYLRRAVPVTAIVVREVLAEQRRNVYDTIVAVNDRSTSVSRKSLVLAILDREIATLEGGPR